jgi:Tfp pilus assembly protein PilF
MVSMSSCQKMLAVALVLVAFFATPADARGRKTSADRKSARSQVDFGITVAQQGLWREAIYRWERAVELDPSYAAAYNNLAIAYEAMGDAAKAKAAYEKALALSPKSTLIRQNFDLFKEINERASSQDSR